MATSRRVSKGLSSALGVLTTGARGNRSGQRPAAESAPSTLTVDPQPSGTRLSLEEPWRLAHSWAADLPADQTAPRRKPWAEQPERPLLYLEKPLDGTAQVVIVVKTFLK